MTTKTNEYWNATNLKAEMVAKVHEGVRDEKLIEFRTGGACHYFRIYNGVQVNAMYDYLCEQGKEQKQAMRARGFTKNKALICIELLKEWELNVMEAVKCFQTFTYTNGTCNENQLVEIGIAKGYVKMLNVSTYRNRQLSEAIKFASYVTDRYEAIQRQQK